ncbi:HD domain-containing protein [Patescibacteria group bacterium]|nr:HD domain-containing protein [Patescibacteria group bacterium]
MIRGRKEFEQLEEQTLAPYAVKSDDAMAIKREVEEATTDGRTPFQHDRDRVKFCLSFDRLGGKTQVVLAGHGDHFKNRLLHTEYVANISRDVCRRLGLNEDLAEAIALAHDLGHTCFGHEGEKALNEIMQNRFDSKFEHNEQSLWVVRKLENLNLTQAVRDGLDKHRTDFDNPQSQNDLMPSLEAQVVNIADEIAYKFHDLGDGIRAGAFTEDELESLSIWKLAKGSLREGKKVVARNIKNQLIQLMIDDLVETTDANITANNINSPEDVYKHSDVLAKFSDKMKGVVSELGNFLMDKFYKYPQVSEYNKQGREVVTFLFNHYYDNPTDMPEDYQQRIDEEEKHVVVKDYVAGMTDRYAINQFNKYNQ